MEHHTVYLSMRLLSMELKFRLLCPFPVRTLFMDWNPCNFCKAWNIINETSNDFSCYACGPQLWYQQTEERIKTREEMWPAQQRGRGTKNIVYAQ